MRSQSTEAGRAGACRARLAAVAAVLAGTLAAVNVDGTYAALALGGPRFAR